MTLKEVADMVYDYMQENNIDLLSAFDDVDSVLLDKNPYVFEEIKSYLFHNPK